MKTIYPFDLVKLTTLTIGSKPETAYYKVLETGPILTVSFYNDIVHIPVSCVEDVISHYIIPYSNFKYNKISTGTPIQFILNNNKVFGMFLDYTQYGLIVQYKSENLLIQPEDVVSIYIDKQE